MMDALVEVASFATPSIVPGESKRSAPQGPIKHAPKAKTQCAPRDVVVVEYSLPKDIRDILEASEMVAKTRRPSHSAKPMETVRICMVDGDLCIIRADLNRLLGVHERCNPLLGTDAKDYYQVRVLGTGLNQIYAVGHPLSAIPISAFDADIAIRVKSSHTQRRRHLLLKSIQVIAKFLRLLIPSMKVRSVPVAFRSAGSPWPSKTKASHDSKAPLVLLPSPPTVPPPIPIADAPPVTAAIVLSPQRAPPLTTLPYHTSPPSMPPWSPSFQWPATYGSPSSSSDMCHVCGISCRLPSSYGSSDIGNGHHQWQMPCSFLLLQRSMERLDPSLASATRIIEAARRTTTTASSSSSLFNPSSPVPSPMRYFTTPPRILPAAAAAPPSLKRTSQEDWVSFDSGESAHKRARTLSFPVDVAG